MSVELMFLGFNASVKPWDDVKVRQSAAHAIDRDVIIEKLLGGLATRLDDPLGPNQLCYTGTTKGSANYDPAPSRALLAAAGYNNGDPEIDFLYGQWKIHFRFVQIGQVVAQMLGRVGFKVKLHAPEWANYWSDIRSGKLPMFYMGRGDVVDAAEPLAQYLETGVTPRTHFSDADLDALFAKQRTEFDPEARCVLIRKLADLITERVPLAFMWTHTLVDGVARAVDYKIRPDGQVWLPDVLM